MCLVLTNLSGCFLRSAFLENVFAHNSSSPCADGRDFLDSAAEVLFESLYSEDFVSDIIDDKIEPIYRLKK